MKHTSSSLTSWIIKEVCVSWESTKLWVPIKRRETCTHLFTTTKVLYFKFNWTKKLLNEIVFLKKRPKFKWINKQYCTILFSKTFLNGDMSHLKWKLLGYFIYKILCSYTLNYILLDRQMRPIKQDYKNIKTTRLLRRH